MRISVIIPTYKRSEDLLKCLEAIKKQSLNDFQVLCVCRDDDHPTRDTIFQLSKTDPRIREVIVSQPGLVASMNAGLNVVDTEFVTFTDDDAVAPPHWLETIVRHFENHVNCAAVGGPDRLQLEDEAMRNPPYASRVGTYTWTGRFHATHHCPIHQEYVESEVLKGVNMTYRRSVIQGLSIGGGLVGLGAQVGSEQSLAARVSSRGYKIHFLRDAWLVHYSSPRTANDDRLDMTTQFAMDTTRNRAYIIMRYLSVWLAAILFLRQVIVGNRFVPGLGRLVLRPGAWRLTLKHQPLILKGSFCGLLDRLRLSP